MTISADESAAPGDLLGRARVLYRDLTVALHGRIAHGAGWEPGGGWRDEALIRAHGTALRAVLDIEAGLDERSRRDGAGGELDLDAARAEILARLALWSERG
ncbi:hypothetical protein [Amaricoccus solimangrovi]|uniref:hypothetical protein n=1 Tax=Amaricoccus solimangrovi TaxID=2589815 RepID=UPI001F303625|nr:hypothetical protein [Amaricoccus solimangrovi]